MTLKQNFKYLRLTILVFSLPFILFLLKLVDNYNKTRQLLWTETTSSSITFFLIIFVITFPGFLLHYKYYKQDKGKLITFGSKNFEVSHFNRTNKFCYADIIRVEKHYMSWKTRNPWGDYGYIKIFLKDNSTLTFSCLTHDIDSGKNLFQSKGVEVEDCNEIFPW